MTFPLSGAAIDLWFEAGQYYRLGAAAVTDFLSCTRASNGYAKNSDGTLTSFTSNVLRIGRGTGLLVEDARTNYVPQSADFTTTWTTDSPGTSVIVTADQAVAPDGTTTMDKVSDVTSTGRHVLFQNIPGLTAGATRSFSVFVKDLDRRYVALYIQGASVGGNIYCVADLQTGTITDSGVVSSVAGTAFTSATIEAFTNGVYRVTLTGVVSSADTSAYHMIALSDRNVQAGSASGGCISYTGSSKSIYVWGAQGEEGSFPSSYIPTTGAAATRAADAVTVAGNLDTLLAGTAITIVADVKIPSESSVVSASHGIVGIGGGVSQTMHFDNSGGNPGAFVSYNGSVLQHNVATGSAYNGIKAGFCGNASNRSLTSNGDTVDTAANGYIGSAGQLLSYGGAPFVTHRRLTFWNSKLADATLQALTDPNSANYYPNFVTQQARRVNVLQTGP